MFNNHPLGDQMRELMSPQQPKKIILDGVEVGSVPKDAATYAQADLRLKAVAAVHQWADTAPDDLADDETMADRLLALVIGIADADQNGEIDDNEQEICDIALNAIWDYLISKGVSEDDCDALLNEWDATAGDRVNDLMMSDLPATDEDRADDMDSFAFDADSDGALFDAAGARLDAVYKMKTVVEDGKKVRKQKKISGTVHLTSKQKMGIRKMQKKSHNAAAQMHRAKSMRKRDAMHL